MTAPSRLVFMGTPEFAVPALMSLLASAHTVVAVYTRAPKPSGRGQQVRKTPVHRVAEGAGIPVFSPKTLRTPDAQETFAAHQADLCVVAAYGLILPLPVLNAPRRGCVNLHASLLPRWRGAAPIQRAILAGDTESGVCLMGMEEGLDTGPVYARAPVALTDSTTTPELEQALARAGAGLLSEHLPALLAGTLRSTPQPQEGVTYAAKLEKEEAALDWTESARALHRRIRAFTPWPGATFVLRGEIVKILSAEVVADDSFALAPPPGTLLADDFTVACGEGQLRLLTVQRPGRAPVDGSACLRGLRLEPGAFLSAG